MTATASLAALVDEKVLASLEAYVAKCVAHDLPVSQADLAVLNFFGAKYTELINGQRVTPVFGRGGPPRYGAIWGVMIGWGYDHYGVPREWLYRDTVPQQSPAFVLNGPKLYTKTASGSGWPGFPTN